VPGIPATTRTIRLRGSMPGLFSKLRFGRIFPCWPKAGLICLLAASAAANVVTEDYLVFDGKNDAVTSGDVDVAAQITLEAWIRPASIPANRKKDHVVSKGPEYELTVSAGARDCDFGSGHVQWRATIGGVSQQICGGLLAADAWQHVAGTYDGAEFRLYVNGLEVAMVARSGILGTNDESLTIGNSPLSNRSFDGAIDEVRVWDRALSPAELLANMNVELAGSEPGLVAYYRFNEAAGQFAFDATANAWHAILGQTADPEGSDPSWVSTGPPPVAVPDVVGLAQAAAEAAIVGAGVVSTANSDTVPAGDVISQDPTGGTLVAPNSAVDLVVSLGPVTVSVPVVSTANSDTVPAGDVISQDPTGGTLVAPNSAVDLVVSLGPVTVWPTNGWTNATPAEMGMEESKLDQARDYALTGGGSGFVTRHGRLVYSWGDPNVVYDLKSTTKSIGGTAFGLSIADNLVQIGDLAQQHLPTVGTPPVSNATTGWLDQMTLLQLATHTAGFDKPGGYIDLLFEPGTIWSYSDGGLNWLADVLTVVQNQDLNSLMFNRVFSVLGLTGADLTWRSNAFRDDTINGIKSREFASGISATIDAMARFGYLYLREGQWDGQQVIPSSFVDLVRTPAAQVMGLPVDLPADFPGASDHYGVLWWTNADGTLPDVPTDAYWTWGLFDSLIVVIPSLDIVVARAGPTGWRANMFDWNGDYSVLEPFLTPIVESVVGGPTPVVVPDVVGLDQATAEAAIVAAGLVVGTVTTSTSDTVPVGSVVSQNPLGGASVAPGSSVDLVISSGAPTPVSVPDVVGQPQATAESMINSAGLSVGTVTTSSSDTVPAGDVISQNPVAGTQVAPDTPVDLVVSSGPASGGSAPTQAYLDFDGVNDQVLAGDIDVSPAITIEAWIRPVSLANSKSQDRVASKGTDYELTVSTGDTGCQFSSAGHVQWRATIGGVNQRLCGGVLTLNGWQHIAGTYDGSQFRLYVNGVEVASAARSGVLANNNTGMLIGNFPTATRPFDGDIDEVRIWNRALSAFERRADGRGSWAGGVLPLQ
jgi:beta-lactam-binding protein with PASTA domain/CubicO group peptidase (beta-lactamase class C family)